MIVTAIAGSMNADGSETSFNAARPSVIECATVNAETMPTTGQTACESRSTGRQPARRAAHHRRQQQAEQEQHVVVAGQDVAHALAQELQRARRSGGSTSRSAGARRSTSTRAGRRCRGRLRRLEQRQRDDLAGALDLGDAAVGRIDVAQQRVA